MAIEVRRTFDVLERILQEFPRPDALGGTNINKEWYVYSTAEYVEKSHLFALGLMALGLKKGDKVATVTTNRPEWNFADMGMAMTGIVHVPIYPTISDEEYSYILEHAEIKALFVGDKKLFEKLSPIAVRLPQITHIYSFEEIEGVANFDELLQLGGTRKAELSGQLNQIKKDIDPEDLATIIYTSGTTGIPKGVMLSHKSTISVLITG
jgi:long-chain acyl-CoA synthetase